MSEVQFVSQHTYRINMSSKSEEIRRSTLDLLRLLRREQAGQIDLHIGIVPGVYRNWHAKNGMDEDQIKLLFIDQLLMRDLTTWRWFIAHYRRMVNIEKIAEPAELEQLIKISPTVPN